MKYPKLTAAFDELLSKIVRENGEAFVEFAMEMALQPVPPKEDKQEASGIPPKEVVDGA